MSSVRKNNIKYKNNYYDTTETNRVCIRFSKTKNIFNLMKVTRILPGDIVRTLVQLKSRPAVVLSVDSAVVTVCPLTTEKPGVSAIKVKTTEALSKNRFLKQKSYFTFSTLQMSLSDAKDSMVGYVDSRTLTAIKNQLKTDFVKILS